jgi:hypothetical protein
MEIKLYKYKTTQIYTKPNLEQRKVFEGQQETQINLVPCIKHIVKLVFEDMKSNVNLKIAKKLCLTKLELSSLKIKWPRKNPNTKLHLVVITYLHVTSMLLMVTSSNGVEL